MRIIGLAAAFTVALAAPALAADETGAMRAAASGFYGVYKALHLSGIPGDADRAKFAPFLSPRLDALLQQAAAAEDRFLKANKDTPPMVEGDLFSSLFEGATTADVGACAQASASCVVNLSYSDGKNTQSWTDTVYLANTPAGWRVDDIAYGGSWDFGNKGRLSETLRQVSGQP